MGLCKYSEEQLMIALSFIAYCYLFDAEQEEMKSALSKYLAMLTPEQELVWGAVTGKDTFGSNIAQLYIVKHKNRNEYTVVARGTNPFSMAQSWWAQDLDVMEKVFWSVQSPASPEKNAMISKAANQAVSNHKNLRDKATKVTFWEFLIKILAQGTDVTVNFAGHSLGGLLAATLALWFYEIINSPQYKKICDKVTMNVYSFGAPTAGDKKFTSYLEHVFTRLTPFKTILFIRNKQDVVVNIWNYDDLNNIFSFYNEYGIPLTTGLKFILGGYMAVVKDLEYCQPFRNKSREVTPYNIDLRKLLDIRDFKDMNLEDEIGLAGKFLSRRLLRIGVDKQQQAETYLWIVMAAIQHIFPYLFLIPDRKITELIEAELIKPVMKRVFPGKRMRDMLEKL